MKSIIKVIIIASTFISCEIKHNQPNQNPSQPISLPAIVEEAPKTIKYVFTVFETEEPYLKYNDPVYSILDYSKIIEADGYTMWELKSYCSGVNEIENFNDDMGYKLLDDYENQIIRQPIRYLSDISVTPLSEDKKRKLLDEHTKIIKRYYLSYDTYKEASEMRKYILNGEKTN